MNNLPTYSYYQNITKDLQLPFAFIDIDLFNQNIKDILQRAKGKNVRVASKSIRSIEILKKIMSSSDVFQGLMCFSVAEAIYLSKNGFDDLLLGYPCMQEDLLKKAVQEIRNGKTICFMVDLEEHIQLLDKIGQEMGVKIPVCIDLDMSSSFPFLHFGVFRSRINSVERAVDLYKKIRSLDYVYLDGIMGYEAQIAGVGDEVPGEAPKNAVVKFLKSISIKELKKRREEVVKKLQELGATLRFVNGGGTGSIESTKEETVVTEIAVGSGFYCSGLFDNYSNFKHLPAAAYAIEVVRQPKEGLIVCHGGGYTASGSIEKD